MLPPLWTPASPLHSVLPHTEASHLVPFIGMVAATTAFSAPSFEHPPRTRAVVACYCARSRSQGCPTFTNWEKSCAHTQSWAHLSFFLQGGLPVQHDGARILRLPFVTTGDASVSRSPLLGMHRAGLTKCWWIRRQPPLLLPLSLPACPKPR